MAGSSSGEGTPAGQAPAAALEALLIQYLSRAESEGEGALESLCREHPQQSDALRRAASALHGFGLAGSDARDVPDVLGDFRVLERLGQGGMGVVHLAEQISLGRRVALKLIRPDLAFFGGARERFRREIEAVARLSHPGIVAIYQVGEQRGIPYFAMEHVAGASLADVLRALHGRDPALLRGRDLALALAVGAGEESSSSGDVRVFRESWVRAVIAIGRQVAEALEHAHQRGVFHRDVKPSNVLLSPRGRAALVDFGLATLQGADALTKTGSQIGSLPYMPPERIAGRPGDPALEDVYALGVTLYEMLALAPAFLEEEAPATLQKILDANPPSLRSKNRAVPPDVEVVIRKAIDRDPAQRYATAAAFARDLANVLELRPIEARGASARLRLVRAVQRHPAWAVALFAGSLAVVVGPLVFALQQRSKLDAIRTERDQTRAERERAERNLARTLDAVDLLLNKVADDTMRDVPQMQGVRRQMLEGALKLYEQLEADQPDAGRIKGEVIVAQNRVADLMQQLGRHVEAEKLLRAQLVRIDDEIAASPDDPGVLKARPLTLNRLANSLRLIGRNAEAIAAYRQAIEALTPIVEAHADDLSLRHELGAMHYNLGVLHKSLGEMPEAGAELALALAAERRIADAGGGETPKQIESRALTLTEIAVVDRRTGRFDAACLGLREALALVSGLLQATPDSLKQTQLEAKIRFELGEALSDQGRVSEAATELRGALEVCRKLVRDHPEVLFHKNLLASIQASLSGVLVEAGEAKESERLLREAYETFAELASLRPESPDYRGNLAMIGSQLAAVRRAGGDLAGAADLLRESVANDLEALSRAPKHPVLVGWLADHRAALADALLEARKYRDAAEVAAAIGEPAAKGPEGHLAAAELLARCASAVASDPALEDPLRAELARERADAAVRAIEAAVERGFRPAGDLGLDRRFAGLSLLTPGFAVLSGRIAAGR